jgi:hypothetical protein
MKSLKHKSYLLIAQAGQLAVIELGYGLFSKDVLALGGCIQTS